tara:strand:- start:351 stop:1316 length:966 start_codon:yes stop_codon:yes gene_type:complete
VRNLITGINGFAASHLCDLLLASGEEVIGLARDPSKNENIRHNKDRVKVLRGDVGNWEEIRNVLSETKPHRIYHMASVSYVPTVHLNWSEAFKTNVFGALHLFEAVRELGIETRVMCVGSSEEYGIVLPGDLPVRESNPLKPITLYGVTKASAGLLANSFVHREGLDIISVRPFNHTGPRQSDRFVCSSFARQVVEIEFGERDCLMVGNLDAQRDFMDVRDTVRAYKVLMERGDKGGIYNVCSGKTVSIRQIVEKFRAIVNKPFKIESEESRFRPERPTYSYGDHNLLTMRTGWSPEILLDQSLRDVYNYWKDILTKEKNE